MKAKVWKLSVLLVAVLGFTACSHEDEDTKLVTDPGVTSTTNYAYIVNNGNWNANDGAVLSLNLSDSVWVTKDIYQTCNGKGIGDAQDLVITGGKLFITSTTGDKIEALDLDGKIVKTVPLNNRSPRYIIADGNDVYFTAYSGYVYKMSTSTYAITDSVKVGDYPEALALANGKIYVANSDYTMAGSNTVSVIDEGTFKKLKDITVVNNPYNQMIAVGSKVYFVSNMDYTDNKLQVIDATTDQVTSLASASVIAYDPQSSSLVCIFDANYASSKSYFRYDLATGKTTDLSGLSAVPNPGQVSVDPSTSQIYVVNADYSAPCSIYVFDKDGNPLRVLSNTGYGTQQVKFNPDGTVN